MRDQNLVEYQMVPINISLNAANLRASRRFSPFHTFSRRLSTLHASPRRLPGLLPITGDIWPAGNSELASMGLALEHVNSDPSMLPGYRLRMIYEDTKVGEIRYHVIGYHAAHTT